MLEGIKCLLIKLFNLIFNQTFEWIIDILLWVLTLFPESPFQFTPIKWGVFGDALGYYLPIQSALTHLSVILSALIAWYAIQHIARFLKLIR